MRKKSWRGAARRAALSVVALLAGGTTFTSCDSKVKSAVTSGLEAVVLSLFDPANYIDTDTSGTNP